MTTVTDRASLIASRRKSRRARQGLGVSMLLGALASACLALSPTPAHASTVCPNEALRGEDNSSALPDCRAYELVSPPYKEGYTFEVEAAASSGEAITGRSLGSFAGTQQVSGLEGSVYSLVRGESGWEPLALSPSLPSGESCDDGGATCFSTTSTEGNTSLWVYWQGAAPPSTIYRREADGQFVEIGPTQPTAEERGSESGAGLIEGASADLSTIVFRSLKEEIPREQELWPGDETVDQLNYGSLYEYTGTGNTYPELVGVRGREASAGSGSTAQLISRCGTELGGGNKGSEFNAVSSDGSVVFFTAIGGTCEGREGEHGSGPAVNELWARIDGDESVAISEPTEAQCAECQTASTPTAVEEQPAVFRGASEDGSRVFFSTEQQLLPGVEGNNLYEYDFAAPAGQKVRLVSVGPQPAELDGVVRIAPDGAHVYYVAGGVLAGNANAEGATAEAGADNLYVYDRETGVSTFVATVWSEADREAAEEPCGAVASESLNKRCYDNAEEVPRLWQTDDERPAVTTEDGQFLVFATAAHIVAEDTATAAQLFEYDAADGELTRVSRSQESTFNDDGNSLLANASLGPREHGYQHESDLPGAKGVGGLSDVSADGSEVFFTSGDALTPGALNEDNIVTCEAEEPDGECLGYYPAVFAPNVYEYESAPGHIDEGQVSLIAKATTAFEGEGSESADRLYGTDASGNDVFFSTTAALVGQDTDTQGDVYDARVDGGFPAPSTAPSCTGETCQGASPAPPSTPTPFSSSHPAGENSIPPGLQLPGASKTSSGTVKIVEHKLEATAITLTIKAPGKGKLTASGTGLKKTTKSAKAAGSYKLKIKLTKAEQKKLKAKKTLKLTVKVAFKPASGKSSTASVKVKLGKASVKTGKHSKPAKPKRKT